MLPQAFHAVDQSLMKVDDDTAKLRAQVSGYENLQSKSLQQLDSIVVSFGHLLFVCLMERFEVIAFTCILPLTLYRYVMKHSTVT